MGIWGIWSGMIVGPTIAMVMFAVVLRACSFEEIASSASQRMKEAGQEQERGTLNIEGSSTAATLEDVENISVTGTSTYNASQSVEHSPTLLATSFRHETK